MNTYEDLAETYENLVEACKTLMEHNGNLVIPYELVETVWKPMNNLLNLCETLWNLVKHMWRPMGFM